MFYISYFSSNSWNISHTWSPSLTLPPSLSLLPSFSLRLFLLRDSQSNPKAFVLTLCHHQKIKHFQILPVSHTTQHTITHREADHCTALTLRTFKDCFLIINLKSWIFKFSSHSAILQSVSTPLSSSGCHLFEFTMSQHRNQLEML